MVRPVSAAAGSGLDEVRLVVPRGQRVMVEVLNGSGRQGAARIATRLLRRAGFDVVYFWTAPDRVDTTRILVRRGSLEQGEWLQQVLKVGTVRAAQDSTRRLELTVILGPDWKPPPGVIP